MYLSLLQIKNFRCFDGNEHSITFKKGLNVLVGENDSGKSAIMDVQELKQMQEKSLEPVNASDVIVKVTGSMGSEYEIDNIKNWK